MAWSVPWNLIGIQVSGDVGNLTIYTDRFNKKVAFPKSPPKKKPSRLQILQRKRFQIAQLRWSQLSSEEKKSLESATLKASVYMTGQNLWIHSALTNDNSALDTLERQTGILIPKPDYIP